MGWAATGIAGQVDNNDNEGAKILQKLAFPTYPKNNQEVAGPGIRSVLNAMFCPMEDLDPDIWVGKKMIGNSKVLDYLFPTNEHPNWILSSEVVDRFMGGRPNFIKLIANYAVLIFQRWTHDDLFFQNTSFESKDEVGQL